MLQFKQDAITAEIILTLTENVSIPNPYYLFVFIHGLTKATASFLLNSAADESLSPYRYNKFTINPASLFAGLLPGEWHYTVYEQVSSTNTDTALSGAAIEYGKLILDPSAEFEFDQYNSSTIYQAYNG